MPEASDHHRVFILQCNTSGFLAQKHWGEIIGSHWSLENKMLLTVDLTFTHLFWNFWPPQTCQKWNLVIMERIYIWSVLMWYNQKHNLLYIVCCCCCCHIAITTRISVWYWLWSTNTKSGVELRYAKIKLGKPPKTGSHINTFSKLMIWWYSCMTSYRTCKNWANGEDSSLVRPNK